MHQQVGAGVGRHPRSKLLRWCYTYGAVAPWCKKGSARGSPEGAAPLAARPEKYFMAKGPEAPWPLVFFRRAFWPKEIIKMAWPLGFRVSGPSLREGPIKGHPRVPNNMRDYYVVPKYGARVPIRAWFHTNVRVRPGLNLRLINWTHIKYCFINPR